MQTLDVREHETGDHSKWVACHTLLLARHFTADTHWLQQIYWGSLLPHDEIIKMSGTQFALLAVQSFLAGQTALCKMVDAKCMVPHDSVISISGGNAQKSREGNP